MAEYRKEWAAYIENRADCYKSNEYLISTVKSLLKKIEKMEEDEDVKENFNSE